MENASNALLMAAGVLISIMIISLGTYLFMTFGNYSKDINESLSEKQINEFNAQFSKYETGTENSEHEYCTVHDIVTVTNLAKDAQEKYDYNIEILIDGKSIGKYDFNALIEDDVKYINASENIDINLSKYSCEIGYDKSRHSK